jgi:hypothetical protein
MYTSFEHLMSDLTDLASGNVTDPQKASAIVYQAAIQTDRTKQAGRRSKAASGFVQHGNNRKRLSYHAGR